MRNLRIISSHFSRSFRSIERNPVSARLISIQSRRYSSPTTQSENVPKIANELSDLGPEKKEKAFDVMLQEFKGDFKLKLNLIKEVGLVTDLGFEEAKKMVHCAPIMVKKGVSKDEAEKIIEKLKAVEGAKVSMW
ncbi:unnamed protein product [Arabis nemorensis]|uniref:Large ribosomal subunit protein bL12 C-terminal domain-containing protein n=1 Tax=Arabis nemorensis TaxID=586526 RepID=A0A565C8S0_9BRAS|nr:unnamed protein product [Arabis nemorensis]